MNKLDRIHPELIVRLTKLLAAMEALGFPMVVTDGFRTLERQQELYAQGRTKPGNIVTNADGIRVKSNHQAKEDGFGHAVDCAFLVLGKPNWSDSLPWTLYGAIAVHLGLEWGGNWQSIKDRPHIQLPVTTNA